MLADTPGLRRWQLNWKTPITLSVLVVILVGAAYYGWQSVVAPPEDSVANTDPVTPTQPTCKKVREVRKEKRLNAGRVLVNVYNAGSIDGLASDTLAALEAKGFDAGVADNAPTGATATNVTILTESRRSPAVRLVAKQFDGKVAYTDTDLARGVDVVVGDEFASVDVEANNFLVLRERSVRTKCRGETTETPQ